jgi:hypothetical protein
LKENTMMNFDDDIDTLDDVADTLRFTRLDLDFDGATDPDATSIWNLGPELAHEESRLYELDAANTAVTARYVGHSKRVAVRRRRKIRDTRKNVLRLREALAEGWDIGPELKHEERRLASLEAADRRSALGALEI